MAEIEEETVCIHPVLSDKNHDTEALTKGSQKDSRPLKGAISVSRTAWRIVSTSEGGDNDVVLLWCSGTFIWDLTVLWNGYWNGYGSCCFWTPKVGKLIAQNPQPKRPLVYILLRYRLLLPEIAMI